MAVTWDRPLTRTLTLPSGERLSTFRDAAKLINRRFEATRPEAVLEHAIALLHRADETGT